MSFTARTSPLSDGYGFTAAMSDSIVVVAGGDENFDSLIVWSTDGINWTEAADNPFGSGGGYLGMCYSPDLNLFVVVGYCDLASEVIATSTDGDTWTVRSSAWDNDELYAVCWSTDLGLFVAVGDSLFPTAGEIIATSPDGITWTPRASPSDFEYGEGVCWSPSLGLFAVVVYGTGEVLTSPDGTTWTLHATPWSIGAAPRGYAIAWSPTYGKFYAGGRAVISGTRNILISSPDGATWTVESMPNDAVDINSIAEVNGGLILVGGRSTTPDFKSLTVSTTGTSPWESIDSPMDTPVFAAVWWLAYNPVLGFTVLAGETDSGVSIATGRAAPPPPPPIRTSFTDTTLWRFFIAALDGTGITDFSRLASNRVVEVVLNGPLSVSGSVPSDNPQVYIPFDDIYNDPYLSEGTRLLWAFRRESNEPPYYTVRGATIIQLVQDAAEQDNATTRFQGWDPWHYMFSRPVCDIFGKLPSQQPGKKGLSWGDTKVATIIGELLRNTIDANGHAYIDGGDGTHGGGSQYGNWGGTEFYDGNLDATPVIDWNIDQDISVGQAWQELASICECDIILNPIYDPMNRPNYLVELNVYTKAGDTKDEQIFAWNLPGRSLIAINRQFDGSARANEIASQSGVGGKFGGSRPFPVEDPASAAKYGEYWAMQAYPEIVGESAVVTVTSLATLELSLRRVGRETVTFTPAPERSPRPWVDYSLGDRIPVWASAQAFRQGLGGEQPSIISASNADSWFVVPGDMRLLFLPGTAFVASGAGANTGSWIVDEATFGGTNTNVKTTVAPADEGAGGTLLTPQYQRVFGWTANISDDALETIDPVLTSPQGG